jgi:hypothetical protein
MISKEAFDQANEMSFREGFWNGLYSGLGIGILIIMILLILEVI